MILSYRKKNNNANGKIPEITKEWQRITKEIGADIRVLDMPLLDTGAADGGLEQRFVADLVLQILSYVAEKERLNIKTRQAQGIKIAKEKETPYGTSTRRISGQLD